MKTIKKLTPEQALAKYLECDVEDLRQLSYDTYGLDTYSLGNQEYAIGTDEEADEAAKEYIETSLWAFNASFIVSECELPFELEEVIKSFQSTKCEDANDAVRALIDRSPGGFDSFVDSAISSDGRGHFLASYDSEEIEEGEYFIYRVN